MFHVKHIKKRQIIENSKHNHTHNIIIISAKSITKQYNRDLNKDRNKTNITGDVPRET